MKEFIAGLCLGIGAGIAGSGLGPPLKRIGKPFVKAAIKGGIQAVERGIEVASHLGETLEDMVAEVRSEMDESSQEPPQSRTTSNPPRTKKKKNAPKDAAKSHNQPSDQQPPSSSHTS